MTIIPLLKCCNMQASLRFYSEVMGFTIIGSYPDNTDPSFSELKYEQAMLHLSSHSGDSVFGSVLNLIVKDVYQHVDMLRKNGLKPSLKKDSPVHQAPVLQTWGNIEFYIDDPDGNTLRLIQYT